MRRNARMRWFCEPLSPDRSELRSSNVPKMWKVTLVCVCFVASHLEAWERGDLFS
jgi:hypothetical protein